MNDTPSVGAIIRSRRIEKNMTGAQLAHRVRTTGATISRIEGGQRAPSIRMLRSICEVLDLDFTLLPREGDSEILT